MLKLALFNSSKEVTMSGQLELFEKLTPMWVNRMWRTMSPERRREAIAILAEIARTSLLSRKMTPGKDGKGDES
jgi:hypothetical protein